MGLDLTKIEAAVVTEWQILGASDTVKGLVAMECAAAGLFLEQVLDGKVELSLASLKGWLLVQAGLILAFLFRKAWAGVEVQLHAAKVPVSDEQVRRIEAAAQARVLAKLEANGHGVAAEAARTELAKAAV